jgi:GMP synthase (glutamine-hydrolysing)
MSFVIVKTGETVPSIRERRGDFEQWIASGMQLDLAQLIVADVSRGAVLPDPRTPRGVVVTGSSSMVTEREPWSEATAGWLRAAVAGGTPVLGICYGHQLLAQALGGRVDFNPRGREIGTVVVRLRPEAREDPLLGPLPADVLFHATHQQSVVALPPGVRWLGSTADDPHHAFAVGASAWAVQFHPEFDADIMRGYLVARRESVAGEGIDVDARLADVREAPEGPRLLRRFRALAEAARPAAASVR